MVVPLALPITSTDPAGLYRSDFTLDLPDNLGPYPGAYQVYLLAGEYLSAPRALTITAD